MFLVLDRLRRVSATASLFAMMAAGNAFGQSVGGFADCAELDGTFFAVVQTASSGPETIETSFTVGTLGNSDLVEIDILADGEIGTAAVELDDGVATFFSHTFPDVLPTSQATSASYTPGSDRSDTGFTFSTQFQADANSMQVTYTIGCTPGTTTTDDTPDDDDDDDDTADDPDSPTTPVVTAFVNERLHRLLVAEPDRARMVRKRLDALWGESGSATSAFAFGSGFRVARSGGRAHVSLRGLTHVSNVDLPARAEPGIPEPPLAPTRLGCWDLWAEAQYDHFADAGDRSGEFAIGYLGLDCQIHPAAIAGLLVQADWMDDAIGSTDSDTDGTGWMAGPYATVRLAPNLFFDIRAAWGQSDNDTNVAGVTGNFDTQRWLVHGRLTGNVQRGDTRITPEISVYYIQEDLDAYVDSSGTSVAAQTVSLGRLQFGPEIARRFEMPAGYFIEPQLAIRGMWDFDANDDVTVSGLTYSTGDFRGLVEVALTIQRPSDFNLRISARYDGIGVAGYDAFGGQLWLNIPLN